jgi:uncharacterized membrane protein YgcG
VLLLLLIKFGRRKPAAASETPPVAEPDAGLHRNYGLPTLPGDSDGDGDGDFFGTAVPDDEDFRSGGGSFGGGGATGDWSDSGGDSGGSDGGGSD